MTDGGKMKKFNNKGFSVVEVVIALTVISIVTITAISITSLSSKNTQAFLNKADAQYLVADAIECFKVTPCSSLNDYYYRNFCTDFFNAFDFRGGFSPAGGNGLDFRTYKMDKSGYYVEVNVFKSDDNKRVCLRVSVKESPWGNEIIQEYYFKSVYEVNQ